MNRPVKFSSVSLGLLRHVVVIFFVVVNKLDRISVLTSGQWLLTRLVSNEGFILFDIIDFTISETNVIPFVLTAPHWSQNVRTTQEKELWHVEHIKEFGAVTDVEPHPVTVGLEALSLHAQEFQVVGSTTSLVMSVGLVLVQESRVMILEVIVVRVFLAHII